MATSIGAHQATLPARAARAPLAAFLALSALLACASVGTAAESPAAPAKQAGAGLLRIVGPVRLSPETGPKLDAEVAQTRALLDRFQKAGYDCAIWAVDRFPAEPAEIAAWVAACMKAFPQKPIVAIDGSLENPLDPKSLKAFLKEALPQAHSVMVNYTRLSNRRPTRTPKAAIAAVKSHAALVRASASKAFLWLLLEDDPEPPARLAEWRAVLGPAVDGFYLHRPHGLRIAAEKPAQAAAIAIEQSGKPVIRGGFVYTAPAMRPGLEADLREQYQDRMARYEEWIAARKYAGYSRDLGEGPVSAAESGIAYLP